MRICLVGVENEPCDALFGQHTDDLEEITADHDLLTDDRVSFAFSMSGWRSRAPRSGAAPRRPRGERAARGERVAAYRHVRWRRADDVHVDVQVALLHLEAAAQLRYHGGHETRVVRERRVMSIVRLTRWSLATPRMKLWPG